MKHIPTESVCVCVCVAFNKNLDYFSRAILLSLIFLFLLNFQRTNKITTKDRLNRTILALYENTKRFNFGKKVQIVRWCVTIAKMIGYNMQKSKIQSKTEEKLSFSVWRDQFRFIQILLFIYYWSKKKKTKKFSFVFSNFWNRTTTEMTSAEVKPENKCDIVACVYFRGNFNNSAS